MPERHGLEWSGKSDGKLTEGDIPTDDYEGHYIEDGDTKTDSRYPVVDADGNLRRGNVDSAWYERSHANRDDFESVVKDLAEEFDSNPLPDSAYDGENMELNVDEELAFAASTPDDDLDFNQFAERIGTGFNQYGVRENYAEDGELESVDVVFEAMEPGPPDRRKGVRITEDFLRDVANEDFSREPPHLLDHTKRDSRKKVGDVKDVWFSESVSKLMVMARVPNTGSQVHDEAISRYTHEPPSWRDGSVGFGDEYTVIKNDRNEPELAAGSLQEFSVTSFPGGYDEGGLRAEFAEAVEAEFEEHGNMEVDDMEALRETYETWESMINMTEEDMDRWEDHPCADVGVDDGSDKRGEWGMLHGQPMEEWGKREMEIANAHIDFMMEMLEDRGMPENPADGGRGTCPVREVVALLNRGHNPLDSFPGGNPRFSKEETQVTEFDDPAEDERKSGENSAAVETDTITF